MIDMLSQIYISPISPQDIIKSFTNITPKNVTFRIVSLTSYYKKILDIDIFKIQVNLLDRHHHHQAKAIIKLFPP